MQYTQMQVRKLKRFICYTCSPIPPLTRWSPCSGAGGSGPSPWGCEFEIWYNKRGSGFEGGASPVRSKLIFISDGRRSENLSSGPPSKTFRILIIIRAQTLETKALKNLYTKFRYQRIDHTEVGHTEREERLHWAIKSNFSVKSEFLNSMY